MPKCHDRINKTIANKLIPWCNINNRDLNNIPRLKRNGKQHPYYNLVYWIRKHPECITNENIVLLNEHGMIWNKGLVRKKYEMNVTRDRIYNELIPWCKKTNLKICDIPASLPNKEFNPLYGLRKTLRYKKDELPKDLVNLLDKYGMDWVSTRISLDERCEKYLLSWHKKTKLPLSQMPSTESTYSFRSLIKKHKDELLPETIKKLNQAGMDWTIKRRKNIQLNNINIDV